MAGRHGVPSEGRRSHARAARRDRRRRLLRRDAAQPWLLWLSFRVVLALVVLGAAAWSVLLIARGKGGYWPVVAVGAGALSLLMIGLDVRARRRQRAALRVPSVARLTQPTTPPRQYRGSHHADGQDPVVLDPARPEVPRQPGRHSHRR
ncbi:MAG: hypothetical protein ACJ71T_08060 [Actinomycetales bacterium]